MTAVNTKRKGARIAAALAAVLLLAAAACGFFLGDYYHADAEAIAAFSDTGTVRMQTCDNGDLVWIPGDATAGFIFYPGGKVEHTAYIPLMEALASRNILCVLVEMPFRLAVFDMDAAEGIREAYPQIDTWYIGGHSLGGSMAASYLSGCTGDFAGLVLLGSYSTADLSARDLDVLSVYGSEDLVMNRENYALYKENLPSDFTELILDGGCHAYFGMYGAQEGDGIPRITNEEQIRMTADAIAALAAP